MDSIFSNIDGKLKTLAKVNFICGIILAICSTIFLFDDYGFWPILSITTGFFWILISFITSWFLYAFAEFLEIAKRIADTTSTMQSLLRRIIPEDKPVIDKAQAKRDEEIRRAIQEMELQ